MKRNVVTRAVALTLGGMLAAASCGGDDDSAATSAASETASRGSTGSSTGTAGSETTTLSASEPQADDIHVGGSIRFATDAEPACLVPSFCQVGRGLGNITYAVMEPLVKVSADGYEPWLVESIEPNDDFTAFTWKIRPGIAFHDGTPLTAPLVKTLFDEYVIAEGSALRGLLTGLESVEAVDEATGIFHLATPNAWFPANLTVVQIWNPLPDLTQTSLPIGTGPFKMESWEPNVEIHVVKNSDYWQTDENGVRLPYLDEITFVPISSGDTRINALAAGDVDLAYSEDSLNVQQMEEQTETLPTLELSGGQGLFFNTTSAPTDDVRVRRGLALATEKEEILAAIGGGQVRTQYFLMNSPFYSERVAEATPAYDVDEARQLLDEYINDPARSDGKPVGTPLTIDIAYVNGAATQDNIAIVAQQQWRDAGVEVTLTPKDQATWIGDAVAGNFTATYLLWGTSAHPHYLLTRNLSRWPETSTNYTHFNSDEVISLIQDLGVATTEQAAFDVVEQIGLIVAENVPLIFLQSVRIGYGTSERIGAAEVNGGNGVVEVATVSVSG